MMIETIFKSNMSKILKLLKFMFRKSLTFMLFILCTSMLLKMLKHMFRKFSSIVSFLCWIIENIYTRFIKSNASSFSIESTFACDDNEKIVVFTLDRFKNSWIKNIGATFYMTNDSNLFIDDFKINESSNRKIIVGGKQLTIRKKGIALFRLSNIRLKNVFYVSKLETNLIFVSKLISSKHIEQFDAIFIKIFHKNDSNKIVFQIEKKRNDDLYHVKKIAQKFFEFAIFVNDNTNDRRQKANAFAENSKAPEAERKPLG